MSSIKGGSPSPVIQHPVSDPVDTGAGNTGVKGKSTSPNSVKTPDSHAKTSDSHVKSNDSHAAPHVEGHDAHGDHLDHNVHTLHQVKLEVHGAETFAEGLAHVAKSEGSILKGLQGTVQGEAKLLQMAQKGVQSGRAMAVVGEAAKELSATDLAKLDKATGSIEKFSTLQDKVIKASKTQSKAALKLNALLSKGAEPKIIAQARENLDTAARNASSINNRLEKLRPNLAQAKSTVRAIAQQVHEGKKSLGLMARAKVALASTKAGQQVLKTTHAVANTKLLKTLAVMGESKIVKGLGTTLIVAAVAADGYVASKKGVTIEGKAFRAVAQGGASAILYTQPPLLPVLAAEAFIFDKPHITGPIQSLVQTTGVAVDYMAGNDADADKALRTLDSEMKAGEYGGVIKGANYFGQALADEGVGAVVDQAVDYWSDVSPSQAWTDTKDVWNWLF